MIKRTKNFGVIAAILLLLCAPILAQIDGNLDLRERCERYGFGYEEYQVTTEDGYINTLMRIPYAPDNQDVPNKPPVYLIPDVVLTAEMFTHLGSENSPAFNLASQGFDVWLSNPRGSRHSQDHVELDSDDTHSGYWDYDLVSYRQDYMADITTIKDSTGYGTVGVFAFYNGAISLAYAMAIEPEYFSNNVNVAALSAFAPTYAHSSAPAFAYASYTTVINHMFETMGINVINLDPLTLIHSTLCVNFPILCNALYGFYNGETNPFTEDVEGLRNRYLLQYDMFPTRLNSHMTQSAATGEVTYYDFGPEENLERYGSQNPPPIPYENTNNPVAMFMASQDLSYNHEDDQWYADLIGDNLVFYQYYDFSHYGFIVGNTQLYLPDLIDVFTEYAEQRDS
ncbi:unnamed protein product [Moneuplotes crassus]|uniref:Partial AB-hydrolase lipase domain-containing protein n=1 Tax=Euplotes crassus TaxID=5936 RepID=A0AAD1UTP1_EUPCR|nr:unnamed protein product [Moneuplotes crassus]